MRISGVIGMIGGVLRVVIALGVRNDVGQLIGAIVAFLIGLWSYRAANAFAAVATTDTADQRYLMTGFSLLRRVFLLQAVLVIIGLSVLVVGAIGAAIYLTSR
jgi:hypothetical protein